MSDERTHALVTAESERLALLPIAEQVGRMETFLARHGLLDRAERLIEHLEHARGHRKQSSRQDHQEVSRNA